MLAGGRHLAVDGACGQAPQLRRPVCVLVSSHLGENPANGRWYVCVFTNRCRTMVKVLGFEHGGFFI